MGWWRPTVALVLLSVGVGGAWQVAGVGPAVGGAHLEDTTRVEVNYETAVAVPAARSRYTVQFGDVVTVVGEDGEELVAGRDYVWHPERGEIAWPQSAATRDGEFARVTYRYDRDMTPERATPVEAFVAGVGGPVVALPLATGAALVVGAAAVSLADWAARSDAARNAGR